MLRKRILSAVLSTALIFTTNVTLSQGQFTGTPLRAYAVSDAGKLDGDISWSISGTTLTVSGTGAIPDFDNYSDTPWYTYFDKVSTIKISKGITRLGNYSFMAMRAATIDLPETLTEIGEFALSNCTALKTITVPANVTKIDRYAFYYCTSLATVQLSGNLETIASYAFSDCTSLVNISLPGKLKSLGVSVFSSDSSLKSIVIPSSMTALPDTAFYRCSSLSSLTIPSSVTQFGVNVCGGCASSLTIYGAAGSKAESYAKSVGVKFSSNGAPVITTPTTTQTTSKTTEKTTAPTTTTTITTTVTTTVNPYLSLIKGDVNGDNAVDSRDAVMILREYARLLLNPNGTFAANQRQAADIDANGRIDVNDGRLVLKYFAETLLGTNPKWW